MRFPRIFSLIALLGLVACGGAPRDVLYECVVRDAGYDSVAVYRIPGLVTSNAGTLVAVYDIRHNNVRDLPEDIDIGVSRSTDGGRTPSRLSQNPPKGPQPVRWRKYWHTWRKKGRFPGRWNIFWHT